MLVRRELFHQGSSWLGQMGLGKLWQGPQQMEPLAPFYFCAFKRNDHKRAQQKYFVNKFMFVFSIGGPKNQFGPWQKEDTAQPKIWEKPQGLKPFPSYSTPKIALKCSDWTRNKTSKRQPLTGEKFWRLLLTFGNFFFQQSIQYGKLKYETNF